MKNEFYKTREEIEGWLNRHGVRNYELVEDKDYGFVVNVDGKVDLSWKNIEFIPIKFNHIDGYFSCNHNKLISLEFCPKKIVYDFGCSYNQLTSLEFCPEEVGGNFHCSWNQLTNLEFCPKKVGGNFYYDKNDKLDYLEKEHSFKKIHEKHLECVKRLDYEKLSSKVECNVVVKKNKI